MVSADSGYEFVDWGGQDHVGGGSHGSLHRSDSFATLAFCGVGDAAKTIAKGRELWALKDVTPLVCQYFSHQDGGRVGLAPC
jgi:hypothetical protein